MIDSKPSQNDDHIFADDDAPPILKPQGEKRFHRAILKVSLISLGVNGLLVFVAAVLTSTAPINGTLETVAAGAYRFFTILLLLSFVGIFIAYQSPKLSKFFETKSFKPSREAGLAVTEATPPQVVPHAGRRIGNADLLVLGGGNIAFLVCMWTLGGVFYAMDLINYFPPIFFAILLLLPGLLVTMLVWNRGVVRAFAIGVLPALIGLYFFGTTVQMVFLSVGFSRGSSQSAGFMLGQGIGLTLASLSGMASAVYVRVIEFVRAQESVPQSVRGNA